MQAATRFRIKSEFLRRNKKEKRIFKDLGIRHMRWHFRLSV